MAGPFRENAVQALTNPGQVRPRTSLVTPRRALIALAVVVMLAAGLLYAAVSTIITPARGIGWPDAGGFVTITAEADGVATADGLQTGQQVVAGEQLGVITTGDGTVVPITAPGDAVVMQFGHASSTWTVAKGDPIAALALVTKPATMSILVPGIQGTGFTAGDVSVGATVWVNPADSPSFQCTITAVTPYEQDGRAVVAYIPSPSVARFVNENGSVVWASASCPKEDIARERVGGVDPVSVEVDRRSLFSMIFGGA